MTHERHPLTVADTWTEPGNVEVIAFEPDQRFEYLAGQFVQLTISEAEAGEESRPFGLASAPHEDNILVAALVPHDSPSAFDRALTALEAGDTVVATPPDGEFVLPDDPESTYIFMGVGIGIATARSLAHDCAARGWGCHVLSTPTGDQVGSEAAHAFEDDLRRLDENHDHAEYQPLTEVVWDPETLAGLIPHPMGATRWFVSGPPAYVQQIHGALLQAGLSEDRVETQSYASAANPVPAHR